MTEKMPSSTRFGSRPSAFRMRRYSSSLSPCSATISGVMRGASRTSMRAAPSEPRRLILDVVPQELFGREDEHLRAAVDEVGEGAALGRPALLADPPQVLADRLHRGLGP